MIARDSSRDGSKPMLACRALTGLEDHRVAHLEFRQHGSKAVNQVRRMSHRMGKRNGIDAPPLGGGSINDFRREGSDRPDQAGSRSVWGNNEPIAFLAPSRIVERSDRSVAPALGSSLFDQGKAVIDGCARRTCQETRH